MAKQTFTTGQVLTAAQMTSLQQTAMGGGAATAKTASYTLVAADAGTTVIMNSASATTITVNTSLFSAGDTVFIQNIGAGVSTITAGTATVNTASSLALAQYESGSLYFTAAGTSIFSKADGAAGGGGMTLLSTTSLSGSTESLSAISGSYNNLQLLIFGATATGVYQYTVRPNATTGNFRGVRCNTNALANTNNANLAAMVTDANATDTVNAYCINIYNYANSTQVKNVDLFGDFLDTNGDGIPTFARGIFNLTAAITSIDIVCTSTFNGGTALLYGVK